MAFNIFGKKGTHLEDLNKEYQTEKIKQICSSCTADVNKHLWDIRRLSSKMTEHWLKRFMTTLKEKFTGKETRND